MLNRDMTGQNNPNWKNAGWHTCAQCGKRFHNYNKTRKYCSSLCYNLTRPKKVKPKKKKKVKKLRECPYCNGFIPSGNRKSRTCGQKACREAHSLNRGTKVTKTCEGCGVSFVSSTSANRKYCSYDCHLDSGGALRAGAASKRAVRQYGAKKDANHAEMVVALERFGMQVLDTSHMGGGFPDLICCSRSQTHLVEVKNPNTAYGRRGLNKLQRTFAENWRGGPVYILRTLDDAALLANNKLDELESYGGFRGV